MLLAEKLLGDAKPLQEGEDIDDIDGDEEDDIEGDDDLLDDVADDADKVESKKVKESLLEKLA
jgi:hypothetical protein